MTWLTFGLACVYLSAGIGVARHISRVPERRAQDALLDRFDSLIAHGLDDRGPLFPRFTKLLVWTGQVLIWPAALVLHKRFMKRERAARQESDELKAAEALPKAGHPAATLVAVTHKEAEALGQVIDPLGFVPNKPFGHLHPAWQRLQAQMRRGDRLYKFVVPAGTHMSRHKRMFGELLNADMRGIALQRDQHIVAEFVYETASGHLHFPGQDRS